MPSLLFWLFSTLMLIGVLAIKPNGLFGRAAVSKV